MRRQQQSLHDRRSETHQFNLFTTESSSTTPAPEWLMLPKPTRQALTALMTRLICDHAASDYHHQPRRVGHDV
jgi:hypothetical protein